MASADPRWAAWFLSISGSSIRAFLARLPRFRRPFDGTSLSFTVLLRWPRSSLDPAYGWTSARVKARVSCTTSINFRDVLLEKGWKLEQDLHYERVEGAEHNEAAWAKRVGPFLQFLYPAR